MTSFPPTVGVTSTHPSDMPVDHAELPVWNAENWFYEDWPVGQKIRSPRRTIAEGDSHFFNALALDIHPYVQDQMFAGREGIFGQRPIAGAFVFSAGLGLIATNCVNAFSYGYDKRRFIKLALYCERLQTVKYKNPADFAGKTEKAMMVADLPLSGLVVVDMSQFLSGPYCSLRLLDLGARVIKVERPDGGDLSRRLYLSDTEIGGDSTLFHAINRAKESFAVDLKSEDDLKALRCLLGKADVLIQNFRPGVIERLGLDYAHVRSLNPRLVYASISGYGEKGPWVKRPGQDLLAQAHSGVMWLNGDEDQGPVPFGLAIADMLAGAACAQGILAALVRRGVTGEGGHVETSLFEALIDFQFEVLTTHLNDGRRLPRRSSFRSAHAYLAAPYGVYPAKDGFLAIAMTPIPKLADLLEIEALASYRDQPSTWFTARNEIKAIFARRIAQKSVDEWLAILEPADIWCAKVLNWKEMLESDGFAALDLLQTVTREDGVTIHTTRSPLRIDGARARVERAPRVGEHNVKIRKEFGL